MKYIINKEPIISEILISKKDDILKIIKRFKQGGGLETTFDQYKQGGKTVSDRIKKARMKPGGSNVGKKKFADGSKRTGPYAGPSGGAPAGSYPIPDVKHAKAAIKLSGHAPNPSGIKAAVYRKYPQLRKHKVGGWLWKK